jgi:hypothetical protein
MSYSFHLNHVAKLTFSHLKAQAGIANLKFVEGYPKPQDDKWPLGFTYIYLDKVTARTLEVEYDGNHFEVRIFTASSVADHQLAVDLVTAVATVANARITPEDHETLNLAEFKNKYNLDWCEEYCHHSLNSVFDMFGNSLEKGHQVSGVTGVITIGPKVHQQITQSEKGIATGFFSRLTKLNYINDEDIYQSPVNIVHDDVNNTSLRFSSWGAGVETLLCDMNTVVGVATGETSIIKVALADLPNILPEQTQWLSEELLLVPALSTDDWQDFLQAAEPYIIDDASIYSFEPQDDPFNGESFATGPSGELSASELATLVYAPIAVFCLVAEADSKIDGKEIGAIQAELIRGVTTESKTLQTVMMEAVSDFKSLVNQLLTDEVDINELMSNIVKLLDSRLPEQEAIHFKVSLLRIGTVIAEASGGVLGMFGNKICKAEKQVLADLAGLFGLIEESSE